MLSVMRLCEIYLAVLRYCFLFAIPFKLFFFFLNHSFIPPIHFSVLFLDIMLISTFNSYVALASIFGASVTAKPHQGLQKRISNIAASALNAQAVTSYLVCQVSVQGKQAAYKLG